MAKPLSFWIAVGCSGQVLLGSLSASSRKCIKMKSFHRLFRSDFLESFWILVDYVVSVLHTASAGPELPFLKDIAATLCFRKMGGNHMQKTGLLIFYQQWLFDVIRMFSKGSFSSGQKSISSRRWVAPRDRCMETSHACLSARATSDVEGSSKILLKQLSTTFLVIRDRNTEWGITRFKSKIKAWYLNQLLVKRPPSAILNPMPEERFSVVFIIFEYEY